MAQVCFGVPRFPLLTLTDDCRPFVRQRWKGARGSWVRYKPRESRFCGSSPRPERPCLPEETSGHNAVTPLRCVLLRPARCWVNTGRRRLGEARGGGEGKVLTCLPHGHRRDNGQNFPSLFRIECVGFFPAAGPHMRKKSVIAAVRVQQYSLHPCLLAFCINIVVEVDDDV